MGDFKGLRIFLIILDILALLAAIFFNIIAGHDVTNETLNYGLYDEIDGLFENNIGNLSMKYTTDITPASWAFVIWGVIYLYLLIVMFYILTTLCRGDESGNLYYSPPFISIDFYVFFFLNMGCNVAWLFIWDREYMEASVPLLALTTFTLIICIISVMRGISVHGEELMRNGRKGEIGAVYGIIINGLGMYAAWAAIATLINLAVILQHEVELTSTISATIALAGLMLDLVVYILIDMVFFERYFRYLFTPYIVTIYAIVAIVYENWDTDSWEYNPNMIFAIAIGGGSAFVLLSKIIVSCVKDRKLNFYESLETKSV